MYMDIRNTIDLLEEKVKLDNQMASMGYSPTREAATDEGERYVWKRD